MSVVDLGTFRKVQEQAEKEKNKHRWRLLGQRLHQCWHVDADCYNCNIPIMPGMEYIREVYATSHGIRVRKYHTICPPDPGYEDEMERQREEQEFFARNNAA